GGSIEFDRNTGAGEWTVKDNAFDSLAVGVGGTETISNGWNAYITTNLATTYRLTPTNAHDLVLSPQSYVAGPLAPFYLHDDSPLHRAGSRLASEASLFHESTSVDQTKDGTNIVTIGYHSMALAPP